MLPFGILTQSIGDNKKQTPKNLLPKGHPAPRVNSEDFDVPQGNVRSNQLKKLDEEQCI